MRRIAILGSTGSIGTSTLDIVRHRRNDFSVVGLSAYRNMDMLAGQIREFKPRVVSVKDAQCIKKLRGLVSLRGVMVLPQEEGLDTIATHTQVQTLVVATAGISSLRPMLNAIRLRKRIALANKEPLVMAGALVMAAVRRARAELIPVDSEHSAIFQCLSSDKSALRKIYLTGSGGPFRRWGQRRISAATSQQALQHPRWNMGKKITIDSATMMNKGLELIEACWLFGVDCEQVDILVHPEAIIHSMVEFQDGSVLAQLGVPDMRIPIQYALDFPRRKPGLAAGVDFLRTASLNFFAPRIKAFPCLRIAREVAQQGGSSGCVMNAANEESVAAFLNKKIGFSDIPRIIEEVLSRHHWLSQPDLAEILVCDEWARKEARSLCSN